MKSSADILKSKTKPKTFFDELAEYGFLDEYLRKFLKNKYNNDEEFQNEMFELLMTHSQNVQPEIESFVLEKLCESLSYFMEYTKPWRIQEL